MATPESPQGFPYGVVVEEGKTYLWCSCGKSAKQPFCDAAHKGTEFVPIKYTAEASKRVSFCGCKHSKKGAVCDGSHNRI